jgi:antirestriction protein ArdC
MKRIKTMKKDRYQIITDTVIEQMENLGSDWLKSWSDNAMSGHHNVISKKAYQGTNIFLTAISSYKNGFQSNEWGTYKQWQSKGHSVKKGSKGTDIIFFDKIKIEDAETKEEKFIPLLKGFSIFNADQIDGYQTETTEIIKPTFNHEKTEQLITNSSAIIKNGGSRAFYTSEADFIQMPNKTDFQDIDGSSAMENYYSTLLHELTHWTGHTSRLDRKLANKFGSNAYAFEELVAEIGSVFLTAMLGIEKQPQPNHAKYLNNWVEVLKQDKRAMVKAFGLAQKASDYILAYQDSNQLQAAE